MLSQRLSKVSITIALNHNGPRRFLVFVGGEFWGISGMLARASQKKVRRKFGLYERFSYLCQRKQ